MAKVTRGEITLEEYSAPAPPDPRTTPKPACRSDGVHLPSCYRVTVVDAMEFKWLEDFLSLAQTSSFCQSAEERSLTQSGFSRRIKGLELWVGTPLVDRSTYPTTLTLAHLRRCYENPMGEALKAMALEGHGIAWLTESSVSHEFNRRRVARAGDTSWDGVMDVRIYRSADISRDSVDGRACATRRYRAGSGCDKMRIVVPSDVDRLPRRPEGCTDCSDTV